MFKTFLISTKIKKTYAFNKYLSFCANIPFLKKVISPKTYQSKILQITFSLINFFKAIFNIFLSKFIYILILIFISSLYPSASPLIFLHLFVFFTLIGTITNTELLTPTKEKYYSIILLKMDAQKYALCNYLTFLLKNYFGLLPFIILTGIYLKYPLYIFLLMSIFPVITKPILIAYNLHHFSKTTCIYEEKLPSPVVWFVLSILIISGLLLPYFNITFNYSIFLILFFLFLILGTYSLFKIFTYPYYLKLYKKILIPTNVFNLETANTTTMKNNYAQEINYNLKFKSTKKGYQKFHELFVKRHYHLLNKALKTQSLIILTIFIFLIFLIILKPPTKNIINNLILNYLPYFSIIMYALNRGTAITKAMFINSDHSLLTYPFFKSPKILLGLFKSRLKTIIKVNFFPALLIAIGLTSLLYLTGGTTNNLNYLILFTTIIAMSIFFSVHYLVLYYLFQPFSIHNEFKNNFYLIIQGLTYLICYYIMGLKLTIVTFGIWTLIFTIIYILIALILIYKLAPKTFKIKL